MEFASLEDAFPNSGDSKKRRPKRLKEDGFEGGELPPTDADRPAVQRMAEVPPLREGMTNQGDDLLDESSKFLKKPTVMNSLPKPKGLNSIESDPMPKYFGAEAFTNPNEETLAPFSNSTGNKHGYMLENDFAKSFNEKGFERAAGVSLPVPELRHRWKHMSPERIESAQVEPLPTYSERASQQAGTESLDLRYMKSKIDALIARLDDLENRAAGANPQMEMLTFIMTGLFLMFMVDLAVRKSSNMRMVNVR